MAVNANEAVSIVFVSYGHHSTVHTDCFDGTKLSVKVDRLITSGPSVVQPSHAYLHAVPASHPAKLDFGPTFSDISDWRSATQGPTFKGPANTHVTPQTATGWQLQCPQRVYPRSVSPG
jgi:hypothetical protein